jgi:alanine racemase
MNKATTRRKRNKGKIIVQGRQFMPDVFKNITADINLTALAANFEYLKQKAKTDVMPVLKANAYGHGIEEMGQLCRQLGANFIGVATLGEAMQLRLSGDKGRILGWLYDPTTPQVSMAINQHIDVAIFDEVSAEAMALARKIVDVFDGLPLTEVYLLSLHFEVAD